MKRSFYTIGSLIILLIAAFVFVLVPIFAGGSGHENTIPPFGSYDGKNIRYEQGSDFANYVARYADYFKNQNIEINDSNYYYIFNYAFNSTVTNMAQKDFVAKSGYAVPKTAINRMLRPYFQDENGKYSEKLYRLADPTQVAAMMQSIKDDLYTRRYSEDCYGSTSTFGKSKLYGLKSSTKEIDFMHNLSGTKKSFDMAVFNMDDFPEDEKRKFGNEHSELFVLYNLKVITCNDKTAATTLIGRIKNNEVTFDDAVANDSNKTYSSDDGKLNNSYYYNIKQILKNESDIDKITNLEVDSMTEPLETTVGYSIFKCTEPKKPLDTANADELKVVYRYIVGNEYSVIEDYFKKQAESFIAAAKDGDFIENCEKFSASAQEIKPFALNYGNISITDKLDTNITGLRNAEHNEDFLRTAFSLKDGEVSKAITNGTYILVLKLKDTQTIEESLTDLAKLQAEQKSSEETTEKNSEVAKSTDNAETEKSTDNVAKVTEIENDIKTYDNAASQDALFASDKLKNNMQEVFYKYIASNK